MTCPLYHIFLCHENLYLQIAFSREPDERANITSHQGTVSKHYKVSFHLRKSELLPIFNNLMAKLGHAICTVEVKGESFPNGI